MLHCERPLLLPQPHHAPSALCLLIWLCLPPPQAWKQQLMAAPTARPPSLLQPVKSTLSFLPLATSTYSSFRSLIISFCLHERDAADAIEILSFSIFILSFLIALSQRSVLVSGCSPENRAVSWKLLSGIWPSSRELWQSVQSSGSAASCLHLLFDIAQVCRRCIYRG
jgi:hypothetical protein